MNLNPVQRRRPSWVAAVVMVTILTVHTACSISEYSSTEPEDHGSYTASVVSGTDTTALSGKAVYGTTQNSAGITLNVLYLWTGDPDGLVYNVIWFQRQNLARLEPGDYPIADVVEGTTAPPDDFVALYAFADDAAAANFHSVTGTLTIGTAELELTGTFQLTTALAPEPTPMGTVADTVQVSGTFRAVPGRIN